MSIAVDTYCMECHLKRNLAQARSLGTEEQAMAFLKGLMQLYLQAPEGAPAAWFGPGVTDLLCSIYGLEEDRYRQEKLDSNAFILSRMDSIREKIQAASDPLYAALQFAILGNYLDFAALRDQVDFRKLDEMLENAGKMELDLPVYGRLCRDLEAGSTLLYLTDNAGEIGFDRLLAEQIQARYPELQITFCVRGAIAANDATREDAAAVGIPFPVIDNGSRIAGTIIPMLGQEASQALHSADVIIAKGMANTECMLGCGLNVYYTFLVKCEKFKTYFGKPMFTPVLAAERT